MKTNLLRVGIITFAIAIPGMSLHADDAAEASADEKKWTHLAFETEPEKAVSDPDVARQIVSLGEAGWELVTVLNFTKDGTTTRTVYYFKKPKS